MAETSGEVFARHLDYAYRVALSATRDAAEAEDVVQEAFLRFAQAWKSFDRSRPARPFLARVVVRTAMDRARSAERRAGHEQLALREGNMQAEAALTAERAAALDAALMRLEAPARLAVSLRYLHGLSLEQTAETLELPRATASDLVNRALGDLRKTLSAAGLGALALPAAFAALPQTAAPASLKAAVARLSAQQAAAPVAAAKGGVAMKVLAGVVLAGALAGAVVLSSGFRVPSSRSVLQPGTPNPEPGTSLAAPPIERKDPAPDQAYKVEPVPAESTSMGYTVDDAARLFWVDSATPTVWRYEPDKRRNTLLSGGAFGVMDGPLDRARFGGWAYNQPAGIQVSGDGQGIYVRERSGLWRLLDLKAGVAKTLFPITEKNGAHNVIARDKSGEMYIFKTSGEEPADTPGCKKLKVAPFRAPDPERKGKTMHYIGYMDGYALDVEKMRFYWHARGDVMCCDLKTGEVTDLNPGPKRGSGKTGDVKGWTPYCPAGLSISPSGRFIYVGGGDDDTCWRFDLEKDRCDALGWNAATETLSFGEKAKGWRPIPTNLTFWPNVVVFSPDGSAYWATQGCMRLVPAK